MKPQRHTRSLNSDPIRNSSQSTILEIVGVGANINGQEKVNENTTPSSVKEKVNVVASRVAVEFFMRPL